MELTEAVSYGDILPLDFTLAKADLTRADIVTITTQRDKLRSRLENIRCTPVQSSNAVWSLDDKGELFLTTEQADGLKRSVVQADLFKNAIKSLPTLHFPQEKLIVDGSFCNESIYGKCGLYYVTGFIRVHDA